MKTVTLEQFKRFLPCWLKTEEGEKRLEEIGSRKEEWTALDVLELEDVSPIDKFWAVLREDFLPWEITGLFALKCKAHESGISDSDFEKRLKRIPQWQKKIIAEEAFDIVTDVRYAYCNEFEKTAENQWQIEELKKMLLEEKEREEHEK